MKVLLVICMLVAAPFLWAADNKAASPAAAGPVTGEVLEVRDVESYTYLRLKTAQGETWAAVPTAKVKKGAKVTVDNPMVMNNFQSKALNKTFDKIVFGTLAGAAGAAAQTNKEVAAAHAGAGNPTGTPDVKVAKASGANAYTVADVLAKPAAVKDKPVLIRGKVVKYNGGIMGKNWIHLRDGSGSAADNTNDLIVTSTEEAKVGDVITVKGVVRTDKDFGAGYSYKAIVEDATLQR
ncbi:MAG TPA: nucleotide-binding protein [Ramlibacter sp.]|nr:nucleotide-binding protein [Ramlibacter sp.]